MKYVVCTATAHSAVHEHGLLDAANNFGPECFRYCPTVVDALRTKNDMYQLHQPFVRMAYGILWLQPLNWGLNRVNKTTGFTVNVEGSLRLLISDYELIKLIPQAIKSTQGRVRR